MDRAREALSDGVVFGFWSGVWANPYMFYKIKLDFCYFFSSFSHFLGGQEGLREKVNSPLDRARRVLSWSAEFGFWSGV